MIGTPEFTILGRPQVQQSAVRKRVPPLWLAYTRALTNLMGVATGCCDSGAADTGRQEDRVQNEAPAGLHAQARFPAPGPATPASMPDCATWKLTFALCAPRPQLTYLRIGQITFDHDLVRRAAEKAGLAAPDLEAYKMAPVPEYTPLGEVWPDQEMVAEEDGGSA